MTAEILLRSTIMCLLTAVPLPAQEQPNARRQFEVASIKPNKSGRKALQGFAYAPGGRFTATNATLVDVIVRVYPTRRIQMQGGPDWIDSERFDFVAKADPEEGKIKPEQWTQMVQVLLEDRFKLAFHTEMRDMQVLALVTGKGASKLQECKDSEETSLSPGDHGQMVFRKMSIVGLVNTMANILHTPVVDRTGIAGFYDFTLDPNRFAASDNSDRSAPKESFGDLMVNAVREQLGLHLEKQRDTLKITVIDRAERPAEN
jgi:uncharacterized protein (TIGR03435 family)